MIKFYETNSYKIEVLGPQNDILKLMIPKLPHHKKLMIQRTLKNFEDNVD